MTTTYEVVRKFCKSECARRDTVDEVIDSKIQQAVGWIERNYSLEYMKNLMDFQILGGALQPGPYTMPGRFKTIEFMRLIDVQLNGAATFKYLEKYEHPMDQRGISIGLPNKYWIDGATYIWFNAIPETDIAAQVYGPRFSGPFVTMSGIIPEATCWLFDNALDVLVAKTMHLMAPWLRQNNIFGLYSDQLEKGIKTMIIADEEFKRANTSVKYGEAA